jgi:peroxiredoxin
VKRKPSARVIFAITALAAFTAFITWRAKSLETAVLRRGENPAIADNDPAPAFALQSLDGRTVSLADYRGKKKLVVSFWASWCGPCRMEMPALRTFYEQHRRTTDNFEILAISVDEDRADAEAFASKEKLPFPVLLDLQSTAAQAYGAEAIPTLYVVDENGKVIYGQVGYDAALEIQLARHLGIQTEAKEAGTTSDGTSH